VCLVSRAAAAAACTPVGAVRCARLPLLVLVRERQAWAMIVMAVLVVEQFLFSALLFFLFFK
jgi:hypothetical protein